MPLSKARDKERKRLARLEKAVSTPYQSNAVRPDIPYLNAFEEGNIEGIRVSVTDKVTVEVQPASNPDELDPVPCLTQELQKEIAFSMDVKTRELDSVQPNAVRTIEDAINRGVVLNPCIEIETISPKIFSAVGLVQPSVQPDTPLVDIDLLEALGQANHDNAHPRVPLYNPQIHRAGDRVMIQKGKRLIEMVIPELDADGYPVYEE